jgi:hypothetical protein
VQFVGTNDRALPDAQSQVRQMAEAQLAMQIERKLADLKMRNLEERLLRERALAETQRSLARFATETEIQARLAQLREELLRERMAFVAEIAARLRIAACADEGAAVQAAGQVAERLLRVEAERDALRDMAARLRGLLRCSTCAEVVARVAALCSAPASSADPPD